MLAKVLVLSFVAAVFCEEHAYNLRTQHEPAYEYRQHYEHIPQTAQGEQGPAHEVQYNAASENHGHGRPAYSVQSVIHHLAKAGPEDSQESHNDHVAPVYQYIQEEEAPVHKAQVQNEAPANHYQAVQFVPPQTHQEVQSHAPVQQDQPQHAHSHGLSYYNDAKKALNHGGKFYTSMQHAIPVHHVSPVHHANPVHQVVPVHHEASVHVVPEHHAEPVHVLDSHSHDEPVDYYAYPKYQYEYKVEDPHTGDNKFQHEIRDGDVVKGVYGLTEADGSVRTVEYSSDKHSGFNAVVKHTAPGHHVEIKRNHHI